MESTEIDSDADAEERASRRKRDALRGDKPVQFSMFDPVVAYDAISNNWINVAEVAKLGIQAAHKKLGVAREERVELQIGLDNLRQQLRGMQEHHVSQMDVLKVRLEILEKITKRKKKYRNGKLPTTEQLEHMPQRMRMRASERETMGGRAQTASKDPVRSGGLRHMSTSVRGSDRRTSRETLSHLLGQEEDGSSSDESSVRGVTPEQQSMLDKIQPLAQQIDDIKTGVRKDSQKTDALHKKIEKSFHQIEMLQNRINDELSTRALSLLFRQVVFTDLPAVLENFVQDKFQAFRKVTDALERKMEAEVGQRKHAAEVLDQNLAALSSRIASTEVEVQNVANALHSSSSSSSSEEEESDENSSGAHDDEVQAKDTELQSLYAQAASPRSTRAADGLLDPELQVPPDAGGGEQQMEVLGAAAEAVVPEPRANLPLPIPKRQMPSSRTSLEASQASEVSGPSEGALEEAGLPRTLDRSESSFWAPPEDPEVDHPQRAGLSDESSSKFFPRSKSRKGAEVASPVSTKSTKNREGASTRRRTRLDKVPTQKETQPDSADDGLTSPGSSQGVSAFAVSPQTRRHSRIAQKAEEAINALLRTGKHGKDGGDKNFSVEDLAILPTLQESQKAQKETMDRLTEDVSGLSSRLGVLEETVKELSASVSQLRELSERRHQEAESRLGDVEGRTDSEFARVINVAEERVMSFLKESELERARLWHQMAVLFPRFIQEDEDGAQMTITEARMFALDVRLDTLEGGILRLLARDPHCMPKPRRRHVRRVQPDKEADPRVANRSPSPIYEKPRSTSGEDGECATRASASPASSPEPRPVQLPTLTEQVRPSSHSKLRELLEQQQDLIRQVGAGDRSHSPPPELPRPASVPLERIATIRDVEVPHRFSSRHPPSRVASAGSHRPSVESAVLEVMEEARSVYDDTAEAVRSLGHLNPGTGRWRAGDAASGRVLEQATSIESAKQRKSFQPWTPRYKPVRPLDHLRDGS